MRPNTLQQAYTAQGGHLQRQRLDPLTLYRRLWLKRRTMICYYMCRASIAASNCRQPMQGRCLSVFELVYQESKQTEFKLRRA